MSEETHFRGNVTQKAVTLGPDGDVLLVRHPAGRWVVPGGRLNEGEAAVAGLRREMREETGLDVVVERPVATGTGLWTNDDDEPMFTVVYRCRAAGRAVTLNEEHDDHAWLAPPRAVERVSDPLADVLERGLERR